MASDEPIGEWRRRTAPWWESPNRHCELCGRPLGGRTFVVPTGEAERSFCGADCAEIARDRGAGNDTDG